MNQKNDKNKSDDLPSYLPFVLIGVIAFGAILLALKMFGVF